MPEKATMKRVARDRREGKSASTQAGEFVREEIHHIRAGKHGARSTKQAIAIALSKARRAGVHLGIPKKGTVSQGTREQAMRDDAKGRHPTKAVSRARSRATTEALEHESRRAASSNALARQTKAAARKWTAADRSASARKAARTRARRSARG